MRTTAAAVLLFFCLMPRATFAYDWSVKATQSETVSASDNLFLSPTPPAGGGLASYSTISASAEARTPTYRFEVDGYGNYNKYWGPDTAGLPTTENIGYGFTGHYEDFGKNTGDRNYLNAGFNQSSAAFALLGQLGVLTNVRGAIDALNFSGGLDRSLSARDTVSLSATSTLTSYEPSSAGTALTDTSATASWSHHVSSLTTLTTSSNAEWLSFDNVFGTNVLILRNQAGFQTNFTPLLSFQGSWGVANVQVENTGTGSGSASSAGFITNMLLTYKALKDTTFTLEGFQTIGPTVVGTLVKASTLRATMTHVINSVSSLALSADVNELTSTGTSQFASASISYSRTLAREWTANLSYRYIHSFGTTGGATVLAPIVGTPIITNLGVASSNTVTVVVSRSLTVLPHTN